LKAPLYIYQEVEVNTSTLKISSVSSLTIERPGTEGFVYFTTDGTDPRTWDLKAKISTNAISENGIIINKPTTLKARIKNGDEWSPLHQISIIPDGGEITINIIPDEARITVTNNLSKINTTEKLLLFPNPVTNNLFLSKYKEYVVYSSMGRVVMEGSGSEIPMVNLPKGLYLVVIDNVSYKILKGE